MNQVDLLKDVFLWAYERSAEQYAAVRQSMGEPDPFRFKHSAALRRVVSEIVRGGYSRGVAYTYLTQWADEHIASDEQGRFREMAES